MDKKSLSERDICTKFITPALVNSGWDLHSQIREEVTFTQGRVIVRGRLVSRGKAKRADYILYHKPNIPIPPFEEQKRIVAKVEQLMALCDELQARLNQSQDDSGKLIDAVLYETRVA